MNTYHKQAKAWAVRSGAIMEDIITNFELKNTRRIRVCPCCAHTQDKAYDPAYGTTGAGGALSEVWIPLSGDGGDER